MYIAARLNCALAPLYNPSGWQRAGTTGLPRRVPRTPVPLAYFSARLNCALAHPSLVGGEPVPPSHLGIVLQDPGVIRVHRPEVDLRRRCMSAGWSRDQAQESLDVDVGRDGHRSAAGRTVRDLADPLCPVQSPQHSRPHLEQCPCLPWPSRSRGRSGTGAPGRRRCLQRRRRPLGAAATAVLGQKVKFFAVAFQTV